MLWCFRVCGLVCLGGSGVDVFGFLLLSSFEEVLDDRVAALPGKAGVGFGRDRSEGSGACGSGVEFLGSSFAFGFRGGSG